MRRIVHVIAEDTEVKGFVLCKSKTAITIRLDEPKTYSCTATCYVGEHSNEQAEDLLKALYLMIVCIEAILQHDEQKCKRLKVLLHHATDRMVKLGECLSTVRRLLDDAATSTNDIKILYAVLTGEYRYWFSQRARIFNDFFKESIGRWEFCGVPPMVDDILRKGCKNNLSD